ncbi:MAG TPA: hypothetical protein VHM19_07950 [Polyangiales bacterium]|jgi:hypothetical protein|nr:hypothetical protein [Polyangiales bacterium]
MSFRAGTLAVTLWTTVLAALGCSPDHPGKRGKQCVSDADCGSLACIAEPQKTPEDLAALPLACDTPADARAPHEACERGDQCALGVCLLAGACARPCANDDDCEAREECAPVYARTSSDALQTLHACVSLVDLPAGTTIDIRVDEQVLQNAARSLKLSKVAPPTLFVFEHLDDHSWPLSGSTCRPPLCAKKLEVAAAGGATLFDADAVSDDPAGPLNPIAEGDHVSPVTLLLPNGPRAPLSDAGYTMSFERQEPGRLRVTRLHREQVGHQLDLNLYFVGANGLAAEGDRGPAFIADALDEVDGILAQADIFLGDVRQVDVTGKLLDEGTPIDAVTVAKGFSHIKPQYAVYPELPELWKLSAGASNVALDIFFVADIEMRNSDGGDVGGISGGTPGPLGMHGTAGSGIAISTDMMTASGDPRRLGRTLAHEIGHMLGLFHPTEITGIVFDPLPDTPVCGAERDDNNDGILDASECQDAGADNLMFPTTETSSTKLTEQQRDVLRSAILLQ